MFITWVIKPERNARKSLLEVSVRVILLGKAGAGIARKLTKGAPGEAGKVLFLNLGAALGVFSI